MKGRHGGIQALVPLREWISGYLLSSKVSKAMIYVSVHQNESIDQAMKRFNMKIQQSGLLRELKDHAYYEKPSEKRRRASRRRVSRP